MTEQLQALPVQDGQDPLNSYHEICRRAFSDCYGDSEFYDCFRDEVKDLLRLTAHQALVYGIEPIDGPLLNIRQTIAVYVIDDLEGIEA